jgi:hypothetical protein
MEVVVARLLDQVEESRRDREPVPAALRQSIHGFETELRAVRRRLADLADGDRRPGFRGYRPARELRAAGARPARPRSEPPPGVVTTSAEAP